MLSWFTSACLLAIILHVTVWVPWSQRPDSPANKELFLRHTRMAPDSVTQLRADDSGPGYISGWECRLFRFDYYSDETIAHLVKNLSLETKPSRHLDAERVQWWKTDSKDMEYFEDTDVDRTPVISMWMDRKTRRCFVRMASF